ncbi:nuclear transport factor 2 family protein [Gemella cuniculi]|uniref:nuclear transport factor 2 family protein n=1 Tax=Gemella cuniculi TaxID=150240 RepID=UPI0003F4D1D5|nr:nuclear transport factor 2 family protein [Gemella cuniculi]
MTKDEKQIVELYRNMQKFMVEKNTIELNKILSDDFYLIHMTGYKQNKKEWLEQINNEKMRYFSTKEENISYVIDDGYARLVGQNRVDARIYGSRHIWPLQLTINFEKLDERWVAISSFVTTY